MTRKKLDDLFLILGKELDKIVKEDGYQEKADGFVTAMQIVKDFLWKGEKKND